MRTQEEIVERFHTIRKNVGQEDFFGFRQEALLECMTLATVQDAGILDGPDFDPSKWTAPDVEGTAREYLVFAVNKAYNHRGISATRSIEKLGEWLWCLGDEALAQRFEEAEYAQYGAPKLQVLIDAWGVESEYTSEEAWTRMAQGLPCTPGCGSGCG